MSALYDLFENPPSPDGEKQPLHARIVSKGTVDKKSFWIVSTNSPVSAEVYWQEPWKPLPMKHGIY